MYFQTLVYNQILFASLPLSLRTLAVTGFRHVINLPVCVHVLCVVDVRIGPITIFCCCCCFVRKYWIVICAYLFMILPEICSSRKHTRTAHIFSADSIKPIISIIFFFTLVVVVCVLSCWHDNDIDNMRYAWNWWISYWVVAMGICGMPLRYSIAICLRCMLYVRGVCMRRDWSTCNQDHCQPEMIPARDITMHESIRHLVADYYQSRRTFNMRFCFN